MIKELNAYIYKQQKSSMQSGHANSKKWILEFKLSQNQFLEPIMHWTGSTNMQSELKLKFDSLQQAHEYADQHGIKIILLPNQKSLSVPKSYSDNFRSDNKI